MATQVVKLLTDFSFFTRLSIIGATWMFAFLGALSSDPRLGWIKWVGIFIAGTCFHFFAYVTNDLIDLDLDKTSSLRTNDPMVRGVVVTRQAFIFAVVQLPISLFFCWMIKTSLPAVISLVAAFILILAYNVWGKRAGLPFLTDIIQGLSWAFIFVFGAFTAGSPSQLTFFLSIIFIVLYIIMINGIHGSLRDIQSDSTFGVYTMAIGLGGKFMAPDSVFLPQRLKNYAAFLHLLLISLPFLLVWFDYTIYSPYQLTFLLLLLVLISILATRLALKTIKTTHLSEMIAPGTIHAFLVLFSFFLSLLLFRVDWVTFCFIIFLFYAPTLAGSWLIDSIKFLFVKK